MPDPNLFEHPETTSLSFLKMHMDCFENSCFSFDEYPLMKQSINIQLEALNMRISTSAKDRGWASHGANMFTIQGHEASVEEHTDDVDPKGRFGIIPIVFIPPEAGSRLTRFDCRPVFNFIEDRKKVTTRLNLGEVVVFPPNKPHSLIYYGHAVKYLIFDVEKSV